jgi:hypothetical protein
MTFAGPWTEAHAQWPLPGTATVVVLFPSGS